MSKFKLPLVKCSELLSSLKTGPFGSALNTAHWSESGIPVITIGSLGEQKFIKSELLYIDINYAKKLNSYRVYPGDIVFSRVADIGRAQIITSEQLGWVISSNLMKMTVQENKITPEFLYHSIKNSPIVLEQLRTHSNGNGRLLVNSNIIKNIKIPLPSISLQKSIVNALTLWDKAIEKTETLIAVKEKQFEWLVRASMSTYRKSKWNMSKLRDLFSFMKGAGLSKDTLSAGGANKCVLYGQLYTTYGRLIREVISKTELSDGVKSKAGDILIPASTTTSAIDLANATAILKDGVLLGSDINILRPSSPDIDSVFFAYYLTHYKKYEIAKLAQGITIVHLYGGDLKEIEVDFPSLSEQKFIVHMLTAAETEITLLNRIIDKYKAQKLGLMQKLLTGEWHIKNREAELA